MEVVDFSHVIPHHVSGRAVSRAVIVSTIDGSDPPLQSRDGVNVPSDDELLDELLLLDVDSELLELDELLELLDELTLSELLELDELELLAQEISVTVGRGLPELP
jgi:hypothetical protein